jgi:predicted nucleic acid-binding protein
MGATRIGRFWSVFQRAAWEPVPTQLRGSKGRQQRDDIRDLRAWQATVVDQATVATAWDLEDRVSLSWRDSLIVASATELGCDHLLTEDLQDGQAFDRLVVTNPFQHTPG